VTPVAVFDARRSRGWRVLRCVALSGPKGVASGRTCGSGVRGSGRWFTPRHVFVAILGPAWGARARGYGAGVKWYGPAGTLMHPAAQGRCIPRHRPGAHGCLHAQRTGASAGGAKRRKL